MGMATLCDRMAAACDRGFNRRVDAKQWSDGARWMAKVRDAWWAWSERMFEQHLAELLEFKASRN